MHRNQANMGYFLTGMAMGAVAALCFAPKSGSETRQYLRSKADEGADYIKDRTEEMSKDAVKMINRGSRKIQSQMDSVVRSVAAVCR